MGGDRELGQPLEGEEKLAWIKAQGRIGVSVKERGEGV